MSAVDLIKSPQKVLGRSIRIVTPRIIGKVASQRRSSKLGLEEIDFVEEEDDTCSHEPS